MLYKYIDHSLFLGKIEQCVLDNITTTKWIAIGSPTIPNTTQRESCNEVTQGIVLGTSKLS